MRNRETSFTGGTTTQDINVKARRSVAAILDGLFIVFAGTLIGSTFGATLGYSPGDDTTVDALVTRIITLAIFILVVVNFVIMQGLTGQSVGKKLLKIKVVRDDTGGVPSISAVLLRTVLLIVDGQFFYLVGFLTMLISQKNQRLGDMAARTVVVRGRPTEVGTEGHRTYTELQPHVYKPVPSQRPHSSTKFSLDPESGHPGNQETEAPKAFAPHSGNIPEMRAPRTVADRPAADEGSGGEAYVIHGAAANEVSGSGASMIAAQAVRSTLRAEFAGVGHMTGTEFEMFVADLFRTIGYKVKLMGSSGDQGVDLLLDAGTELIAVQCKNHARPVGNKPVQEVYAGAKYHGASQAWVVAPQGFTKGGYELASRLDVLLFDGSGMLAIIGEDDIQPRSGQGNSQVGTDHENYVELLQIYRECLDALEQWHEHRPLLRKVDPESKRGFEETYSTLYGGMNEALRKLDILEGRNIGLPTGERAELQSRQVWIEDEVGGEEARQAREAQADEEDREKYLEILDIYRKGLEVLEELAVMEKEHELDIADNPDLQESFAKTRRQMHEEIEEVDRDLDVLEGRTAGLPSEKRAELKARRARIGGEAEGTGARRVAGARTDEEDYENYLKLLESYRGYLEVLEELAVMEKEHELDIADNPEHQTVERTAAIRRHAGESIEEVVRKLDILEARNTDLPTEERAKLLAILPPAPGTAPPAATERNPRQRTGATPDRREAPPQDLPLSKESSGSDVYEHIRRLAGLRDEGLVTSEEFGAKKREFLGRL